MRSELRQDVYAPEVALRGLVNHLSNRYLAGADHFKYGEAMCPATGIVDCEEGFIELIDELRNQVGYPLIPNSWCRTPGYNDWLRENGTPTHPRSLHMTRNPVHKNIVTGEPLKNCAVDLSINPATFGRLKLSLGISAVDYRGMIIDQARKLGLSIGIAKSFIHVDARTEYIGLARHEWEY